MRSRIHRWYAITKTPLRDMMQNERCFEYGRKREIQFYLRDGITSLPEVHEATPM